MNLLLDRWLQGVVAVCIVFSLASCEDEVLVKKNQDLRQQLSELEKKVDMLEINAGEDPGDQAVELKIVNEAVAKALVQLKEQDEEKEALEKEHAEMEKKLRAYQRKYQIR